MSRVSSKVCCKTCASPDTERKEMQQDNRGRYYYGCRIDGVIRGPIAYDAELERQSCGEWEAADAQKLENSGLAGELAQEQQILYARWRRQVIP